MAELLAEAGVPDGVFNVVHGDKVAVDAILDHPDIAAVSFVGSTPIARYIYETGTQHGKRVQALGGAKNHMIVLPDADIDMAADAAVSAAYGSAGERCMAVATVVAVGGVADPLVEAIKARLPKIKVGPGHATRPPRWARSSRSSIATRSPRTSTAPRSRARRSSPTAASTRCTRSSDGFFLGVSLIDDVTPEMDCYRDEIFGPVLTVIRVETYDEAVGARQRQPVRQRHGDLHPRRRRRAASSSSTSTWAWSASTCRSRCRSRTTASAAGRQSLFGDLHMYGPEGIQFYTRAKVVTSRWPDPGTLGRPGLPADPLSGLLRSRIS